MQASSLQIVIVAVIGLVTYLVASRALAEQSAFGYPRLIAAAVSLLGCVGLLRMGDGLLQAILLPAAALLVAVCLMLAVFAVQRIRGNRLPRRDTPVPTKSLKKKEAPKKPKASDKMAVKQKAQCNGKGKNAKVTRSTTRPAHNPW